MGVYLDKAEIPWKGKVMSHMIADTEEELHEMAAKIGLKRDWFQGEGRFPHYDVCKSKAALAVQKGAEVLEPKDLYQVLLKIKRKPCPSSAQ